MREQLKPSLLTIFGIAIVYALVAKGSFLLTIPPGNISPIFPSAGIALAAVLIFGWPALFSVWLGSFAVNTLFFSAGMPASPGVTATALVAASFIGIGAMTGAGVGALLVRRYCRGEHPLYSGSTVLVLVAAGALGAGLISPSLGLFNMSLWGYVPWERFGYSWLTWWLGDALGVIIVTPLILAWHTHFTQRRRLSNPVEAAFLVGATTLLCFLVFFRRAPFAFAFFPLLLWAAYRFEMIGASVVATVIAVLAAIGTSMGESYFNSITFKGSLLSLYSFLGVNTIFALFLTGMLVERKRVETNVRKLSLAVEQSEDSIVITDLNAKIEYANPALLKRTGYSRDELIGQTPHLMKSGKTPKATYHSLWESLTQGRAWRGEFINRNKDGAEIVESAIISPLRQADGSITHYVEVKRDITEHREAERRLRIAATAFESMSGMVITDATGVILQVNRAFTEGSGYTADELVGQTPRLLKSGRHDAEFYRQMWESLRHNGSWQGEIWDRRKSGEIYPKWLTIAAVKDDNGNTTHYVATHLDISEHKKSAARIKDLAYSDQLTGLPNRALLLDRLQQSQAASTRSGSYGALLFIDVDNFKQLNDTLGHDAGNLLLQQVAQRLTHCVRSEDTVARMGGDEFMVLLTNLSLQEAEAAAQTESVGEKILSTLIQPYQLKSADFHCTSSIGATLISGERSGLEDLMKQVDLAMYKAKATGRNALRFFDPEMEETVLKRSALESDLRAGIGQAQFLLHYQPQITSDGHVSGAEVLIRWQHPQRGLVSPAAFIPLAEETGLILTMGHWVLETACEQLAAWASQPDMKHLTVAVNVSAHQFRDPDFVKKVQKVIDRTGANPNRLKLELTESMLVDKVEEVIAKMHELIAKGLVFSLDDFGTGYSSLSYLKKLPLDQLKIDQSFVRDVMLNPNDAAIAQSIVALAQNLGLGVIAEGVETAAQRDFLKGIGCHAYQGYFFSRPVPLIEFEAYVKQL